MRPSVVSYSVSSKDLSKLCKKKSSSLDLNFVTSAAMKLLVAGIFLILIVETNAQWYNFPIEAAKG